MYFFQSLHSLQVQVVLPLALWEQAVEAHTSFHNTMKKWYWDTWFCNGENHKQNVFVIFTIGYQYKNKFFPANKAIEKKSMESTKTRYLATYNLYETFLHEYIQAHRVSCMALLDLSHLWCWPADMSSHLGRSGLFWKGYY